MKNFEQNIHYDTDQTLADGGGLFQLQPDAEQYAMAREDLNNFKLFSENRERLELLKNKGIVKAWLGQLCRGLAREETTEQQDSAKIDEYKASIRFFTAALQDADPFETAIKDKRCMGYVQHFLNSYSSQAWAKGLERESKLGARGWVNDYIDQSFRNFSDPNFGANKRFSENDLATKAQKIKDDMEIEKPKAFEYIEEIEKELGEDLG